MQTHAIALALLALSLVACKSKDDPFADGGTPGATPSGATPPATTGAEPQCAEDASKAMENGKVSRCKLTADFTTGDFICEKDRVFERYADGKLKGCYLKTAKVVDGFTCKEGVSLDEEGHLHRCKLSAPKHVSDGIDVRAGDWITLYPKGAGIRRLELESSPNKIQGLPCKGYMNFLHENGKLKKCELSEDATIGGKKVAAKDAKGGSVFVCFDDKGKQVPDCSVLSGMLAN